MTTSVAVVDLCVHRGSFQLGPLTFAVPSGGRLAVVGPSGSGKTTLLRCLAGFEPAASGTIRLGDAIADDGRRRLPPDRRGLGLVFQDGALWPQMTALQHLQFAAPGLAADDALALLRRAGLEARANDRPGTMSGGEAQRLGLCRALAPGPGLLLLDEPLRSVDVHQRDGLVLLLRTLADERRLTTILVTHDRDEALALATDLVVLREGRMVESGPAQDLLQRPATAFTAAFLLGAACLPVSATDGDRLSTPFGTFARPPGAPGDLRLVLLPGDVDLAPPGSGPAGRILCALPGEDPVRLRVALADQIVEAHARAAPPAGAEVTLALRAAPRFLPWHEPTRP
ncbi:MAG: ABC transporter ATP-binding protein [Planctomycetes bacterium]|nr:ABC transporter ATP-binding protein [Planctomycetota bacterium]